MAPPTRRRKAAPADPTRINEPLRPLEIELDKLLLDESNARIHDERNVEAIATSLAQFGQHSPIVVQRTPEGAHIVRVGNGRVLAARKLGWTRIAAVVLDISNTEATALGLADNRTAELAAWDDEVLAKLLRSLQEDDADLLAATGFDDDDLARLLADDVADGGGASGAGDPDEVPEPEEEPVSSAGDIWLLGRHRLMCGDSTDEQDVAALMDGQLADLAVTDPPYGVDYSAKNEMLNQFDKGNRCQRTIANDNLSLDESRALWDAAFARMADVMRPGAAFYTFCASGPLQAAVMQALEGVGLEARQVLMWLKNNHVLGRADYAYKHEPIIYGWKSGAAHSWFGGHQTSVLEFDRPSSSKLHPTMKPEALIRQLIENSSKRGQIVYEPFSGSGTCVIACEETGRRCFAMELEGIYVDVAVRRWQEFTGKAATHAETGEPFLR